MVEGSGWVRSSLDDEATSVVALDPQPDRGVVTAIANSVGMLQLLNFEIMELPFVHCFTVGLEGRDETLPWEMVALRFAIVPELIDKWPTPK